jgi:hypothetical protein
MRSKIALALLTLTLSVSPLLAEEGHKSCDMHKDAKAAACCTKDADCCKDGASCCTAACSKDSKDHASCKNDKNHAECKKEKAKKS